MLLGLLRNAVWQRLGPGVGAVLSGGIDSSTVVALARRHADYGAEFATFTGYYAEPGFDERRYARLIAGQHHHEIRIAPGDFVENFDGMCAAVRPPFQGMGMFGQYMVAKYIREQTDIRVVLSGEGSDELFGGYARLRYVAGDVLPDGYDDYRIPDGYPADIRGALDYDWQRLPDLLAVDDQMTGAFGLEARAPFTDSAVVAFGLGLPPYERVGKRVLKAAVRGLVPDEILERRDKMGFPAPLVAWANGPLRDFVGDRIGYVPDPSRPWDRGWWYDLCTRERRVAA